MSSTVPSPSPLATPDPWNLVSSGYAAVNLEFMGQFSNAGLAKLGLSSSCRLLDVACGPGTTSLLAAPHVGQIDALDFAEQMLQAFEQQLRVTPHANIRLHHGDGQALPFVDNSFDAAVSMFGLMFFPDRKKGMREVRRVLSPGGRVLISSWAPLDMSPAMMSLFGALRAIDPSRKAPERDVGSLENPDLFHAELEESGFVDIEIDTVQGELHFGSPEQLWDDMARGAAPLVLLRRAVGEDEFARQSVIAKDYLRQELGDRRMLHSTAYLAYGTKNRS